MAITNIANVFSPILLEALNARLTYSALFNTDFQGSVTHGNKVSILNLDPVTVGAYTIDTAIDYQLLSDTKQEMAINQQSYFAVSLDDIDRVQSNADLMGAMARNASYQMQKTIDGFLATTASAGAGIVAGLGTSGTPLEVNSANVLDVLRNISRKLDEANVPRSGRSIIVPPWFAQKILLAGIVEATNNSEMLLNGYVGRYAGFDIFMTTLVPNTTGAKWEILAGTNIAGTMALQLSQVEKIRLETHFADAIRGLAVYGSKITRPATLARAICNEAAEPEL